MSLLLASFITSPYFVTACLGYGFGFITEKCIWACRTSRIRWIATTGVVLGGCLVATTGIAHRACYEVQHRFFLADGDEENREMKSSKLIHTLIFLTSWTCVNTFIDVCRWAMLGAIYTGSPRNKHNKALPSSQRVVLMSRISSFGKNFLAASKCKYPALVEYRSVIDLPIAFVSIPLAATFLSLIMVPGVILLCVANAIEPPRPCLAETKTKCLYKVYPKKFVDDELCVVPALPDSKHPIVSLVNLVMSAAMQDKKSDDKKLEKTTTETKAKESDFHHPDDAATANVESGGEAGAFALFNLVFSTMSNDYFEKRKDIFAQRHSAGSSSVKHDQCASSLPSQLAELAQTSGTCFEDWPQMAIHECVHVRQQMLSTSVMSFLAIYLGQYGRNAFRTDNTSGMSQAYINIAAEKQAYTLESYAYVTEYRQNVDRILSEVKERENSSATVDDIVEKHEQELFPCWEAIRKDFYYKWY